MRTGTSHFTMHPRAHLCTGASAAAAQRATSAIGTSCVKGFDQVYAVVRTCPCKMREREREEEERNGMTESARTRERERERERCCEQVEGGGRNDVEGER